MTRKLKLQSIPNAFSKTAKNFKSRTITNQAHPAVHTKNFASKDRVGYDAITTGGRDLVDSICTPYVILDPDSPLAKEAQAAMAESLRQSLAPELAKTTLQQNADDAGIASITTNTDKNATQQAAPTDMKAFAEFFAEASAKYKDTPRKGSKEAERQDQIEEKN